MATWLKHTLTGLIGAVFIAGCTVTTSTDDDDDFDDFDGDAGSAPRAGSGGRAGAGAGGARAGGGAGGVAGVGGSRAGSGGTAGTGTAGSGPDDGLPDDLVCGGKATEPADSCEFSGAAPGYADCQACLSNHCCDEVKDCYGSEPSDACGWGGEDGVPEWLCYTACIVEAVELSEFYSEEDAQACAFACGTPTDGVGKQCNTPLISDHANALASCMHDSCEQECIYDVAEGG